MAEEKNEQQEAAPAKKLGFLENKVILLGGIVAVQLLVAVGLTTVVIMPRLGATQAATGETTPKIETVDDMGILLSLGEIIVTLRSESGKPRYLRITVDLELADQAASDFAALRLPILRDTVIVALSDRSAAELNRPEGMKGLRDELMRRLDGKLPGEILRHIYFSDLVIQ